MSVWFSRDLRETWERPYTEFGLARSSCLGLVLSSTTAGTTLAATDVGPHRRDEPESEKRHLSLSRNELCTWALARPTEIPNVIIAVAHPASLFRSDDVGATRRRLQVSFTRTTCLRQVFGELFSPSPIPTGCVSSSERPKHTALLLQASIAVSREAGDTLVDRLFVQLGFGNDVGFRTPASPAIVEVRVE